MSSRLCFGGICFEKPFRDRGRRGQLRISTNLLTIPERTYL